MIIDFDSLAKLAASRRPGVVKAWLARNRIHYFTDSKGRPTTTLASLDRALYRGPDKENEPNYEPPQWQNSPAGCQSRASRKKTAGTTG